MLKKILVLLEGSKIGIDIEFCYNLEIIRSLFIDCCAVYCFRPKNNPRYWTSRDLGFFRVFKRLDFHLGDGHIFFNSYMYVCQVLYCITCTMDDVKYKGKRMKWYRVNNILQWSCLLHLWFQVFLFIVIVIVHVFVIVGWLEYHI